MVEGKDVPNDFEVPEGAVMIKRAGPWEFHFSKADYSLFVVTQRYAHLRVENLRKAVETLEEVGLEGHKKGHSENEKGIAASATP